jgi:hypothetical protein
VKFLNIGRVRLLPLDGTFENAQSRYHGLAGLGLLHMRLLFLFDAVGHNEADAFHPLPL